MKADIFTTEDRFGIEVDLDFIPRVGEVLFFSGIDELPNKYTVTEVAYTVYPEAPSVLTIDTVTEVI